MAKAGRKHKRHERVVPNGQLERNSQNGRQEPRVEEKQANHSAIETARIEALIQQAHDKAEAGDLDEALKICSDVLNEEPNRAEALFIAGYILLKAERYGLAMALMEKCTHLVPEREQAWNNLGLVAANLHQHELAEHALKKSLQIKPEQTESKNNMALICVNKCKPKEAIKWADESLAINPNQADVSETRGYASLMLRNWKEGWEGYEHAVGHSKYRKHRPMKDEPYWKGEKGVRLYIRGEQGLGDEILFASCMPDVMKDCHVALECDKRLEGLFKRSFDVPIFGTRHEKVRNWSGTFDAHCLLGTLHRYYRNTDESFPGTPFLKPDPERVLQWKVLVDKLPGLKVGIAWTGGIRNTFASRRSLSLSQLHPLFAVPGISWVSLQYRQPMDLEEAPVKIHRWARSAEAQDLDEVAALVESLDLVISVSTAVVHIAGAIGKECWVLVPEKPHWHYALEGDTLPWYNSVKLFRQKGSWDSAIQRLGGELASRVHRPGPTATRGLYGATEQHYPPSIQTSVNNAVNLKPTANFASGPDGVHVQPLSSPFYLRV